MIFWFLLVRKNLGFGQIGRLTKWASKLCGFGGRRNKINNGYDNEAFMMTEDGHIEDDLKPESDFSKSPLDQDDSGITYGGNQGFWKWLSLELIFPEEKFYSLAGPEAVHYLQFQQHIIGLVTFTTLIVLIFV